MTNFLIRLFAWLERFCVATRNLGFANAVRLLVLQRSRALPQGTSITIRAFGRAVYYRGTSDFGVMSHFFRPGYRIRDLPDSPVRYIVDAGAHIGDGPCAFVIFTPTQKSYPWSPQAGTSASSPSTSPAIRPSSPWRKDCGRAIAGCASFSPPRATRPFASKKSTETPKLVMSRRFRFRPC